VIAIKTYIIYNYIGRQMQNNMRIAFSFIFLTNWLQGTSRKPESCGV